MGEKRSCCEFANDLWKGDLDFLDVIPIDHTNDDLYSVLHSGSLLCNLINKISKNTINEKDIKEDKVANLKLFFYGAQSISCKLNDITVQNLIEGNKPKLLEAFLLTIRHYFISKILSLSLEKYIPSYNASATPEEIILSWVNYNLDKSGFSVRKVSNFDADFQDGEVFAALLSQVASEQISQAELERAFKEPSAQKRCLITLKLSEKINCAKLITVDDISQGNSRLIFMYLCHLFLKTAALGPSGSDIAMAKNQGLEKQLDDLENLLAETLAEKETLLLDIDEAMIDFNELESQIADFNISLDDIMAETATLSTEKQSLDDLLSSINSENDSLENQIAASQKEKDDLFAQLEEEINIKLEIETELNATKVALEDLLNVSSNEITKLQNSITSAITEKEKKTAQLEDLLSTLEKAKNDASEENRSLLAKLEEERRNREELTKNLEESRRKLEESKNIVLETENTKDELFKLLNETIGEVEEAKNKTHEIQTELRSLIEKEIQAKEHVAQLLRKKNEDYEKALAAWKIEREGLLQRIAQLEEELANLKVEMKRQLEKAEREMQEALAAANLERERALAEAENEKDMALDKVRLLLTGNQKQGYLWKQETTLVGTLQWKKKFFVLRDNLFCWYNKEKDVGSKTKPQGVIYCEEARIYELNEEEIKRPFAFQIDNEKVKANIAADSLEEMKEWVTEIRVSKKKKIGVKVVSEETKEKRSN